MGKSSLFSTSLWIAATFVLSSSKVLCATPSISAANGAILKSLGVDDSEIDKLLSGEEDQSGDFGYNNDDLKEKDPEWWRDPLAMFEDSEEEHETQGDSTDSLTYDSASTTDHESDMEDATDESSPIPFEDTTVNEELDELKNPHLFDHNTPQKQRDSMKKNKGKTESSKDSEGLPIEAQRRLAQHSILMKPESLPSKSSNNFSAPALPAILVISKLRSVLPTVPSYVVTLFVSLATTQFVASHIFTKKPKNMEDGLDPLQNEDEDDDGDDHHHYHTKKGMNFLSKIAKNLQRQKQKREENDTSHDNVDSSKPGWLQRQSRLVPQPSSDEDLHAKRQRRISRTEMMEEIERLKLRAEKAEYENEELILETERMNKEMAKTRAESANLRTSMQYVKSQLRENQQNMEKAVLRERQKSEAEMSDVREALVKVLRHERNLMREQVQKTSDQVRALLKEEKQGKKGDSQEEH